MKGNGLRIIKRIQFLLLLILAFAFLNVNVSFAQTKELPKSWMPKWKVGDWWRVKYTHQNIQENVPNPSWSEFSIRFEIVSKENVAGGQGFKVKIKREDYPEGTFVILNKNLSVREIGKKQQQFFDYYQGIYPYVQEWSSFNLPVFPFIVGTKEYKSKQKGDRNYYIQEVHRVSGVELVAKGYKPDGLFKPAGVYYEVKIYLFANSEKHEQNTQIWSIEAPYWVYYDMGQARAWLIEHSWK